jgi:hypothetical protein
MPEVPSVSVPPTIARAIDLDLMELSPHLGVGERR